MLQAGVYGGMPLFLAPSACGLAGVLTDYVVKRPAMSETGRYIGLSGFFSAALDAGERAV